MADEFIFNPEATSLISGFPIRKLRVNVGMSPQGMVGVDFIAGAYVKITMVSGRFARVEKTNQVTGDVVVSEFPLGPLGWDYERMPTS